MEPLAWLKEHALRGLGVAANGEDAWEAALSEHGKLVNKFIAGACASAGRAAGRPAGRPATRGPATGRT
jgi:hypothetical protein